jgi:hypothetical protein
MSIRIIQSPSDASDYRYGVSAEVGIVARRFQVKYFPEVNEKYKNSSGETILRSVSQNLSREVLCEGEYRTNQGVMLFTVGAALTFANYLGAFQPTSGTMLLDDASTSLDRHGWLGISIRASSNPLL